MEASVSSAMTLGERLVSSLPLKTRFHDAHDRRAYLRCVEIARRIVDDPSLIENGSDFLERFVKDDARQSVAYRAWRAVLQGSPEQIARSMLADTDLGVSLRDSAPVFVVFSPNEARQVWNSRP